MSVAAVRPALSRLHSEAAVRPSVLTLSPMSLVTLTDAVRSLDVYARTRWSSHHVTSALPVSRATGPFTCMFPVISHVTLYDICPSHGDPPRLSLYVMVTSM